jgi:prepilin peptidase CpaA
MLLAVKLLACSVLLVLVWLDLRDRRLPAHWVGLVAGFYLVQALLLHMAPATIGWHILVGGLAFIVSAWMFHLGWMGGGDVKLAGAVFLWAGPQAALPVFCVVSLAGLPLVLLMLLIERGASAALQLRHRWLGAFAVARGVPYGVALACGGAWAIWAPAAVSLG